MKKIITTVGTSIFTNYQKRQIRNSFDTYKCIDDKLENIEENSSSADDRNNESITVSISNDENTGVLNVIKKNWLKGIHKLNGIWHDWDKNNKKPNTNASAEIKSILKIVEELQEDVEVYLLATDTVLSVLACELIQEFFESHEQITVKFNPKIDVIENLRVDNSKLFKEGLTKLIQRLYNISGLDSTTETDYYTNKEYILNVTGGFKGIIPFMTIFGQVHRVDVKYIFEDTDELLTVPPVPISIQETLFDEYWEQFALLEEQGIDKLSNYSYDFQTKAESCLEVDKNDVSFSPLGLVLWQKYKESYFVFYATDTVWNEIQQQNDIKRILQTKLWNPLVQNGSKNEKKGDKVCYDDGNNNNRIYNLKEGLKFVIYKTFENEELAKKYIDFKVDFDEIICNSKKRKIKIIKRS